MPLRKPVIATLRKQAPLVCLPACKQLERLSGMPYRKRLDSCVQGERREIDERVLTAPSPATGEGVSLSAQICFPFFQNMVYKITFWRYTMGVTSRAAERRTREGYRFIWT